MTEEQIKNNKARFLGLVNHLKEERPGDNDWEGLIKYLEESDFFNTPASTMFHCAYPGGLCEHSLNVYDALVNLIQMTYPATEDGQSTIPFRWYECATISLFHDISKANNYVLDVKNKKVYTEHGKKTDSIGNFDWVSIPQWYIKEEDERFKYGSHEEDSVFILQKYLRLSDEEIIAILHHTGYCQGSDFNRLKEYSYAYSKYKLSAFLHLADSYSCFIKEPSNLVPNNDRTY